VLLVLRSVHGPGKVARGRLGVELGAHPHPGSGRSPGRHSTAPRERGPFHGTDGVQPGQTSPHGCRSAVSSTPATTRRRSPVQPVDNPCSARTQAVSVPAAGPSPPTSYDPVPQGSPDGLTSVSALPADPAFGPLLWPRGPAPRRGVAVLPAGRRSRAPQGVDNCVDIEGGAVRLPPDSRLLPTSEDL
jgi:hypothetical protein